MKFKDFVKWCNDRDSDGCWSFMTATYCIDIIEEVRKEKKNLVKDKTGDKE